MLHLRRVQPQQAANGGGGCQRTRRTSGVKHLVMRPTQKLPHPNAHLIARYRRRQQLLAAAAQRLRHRERRGKHHRGRVKHGAVVHVILLGHMRSGGIGHGGKVGTAAAAVDEHFTRADRRPHTGDKAGDAFNRSCTLARQRRAKPVDQQVFGSADDRCRDGIEAQGCGKGCELCGRTGLHDWWLMVDGYWLMDIH